MSGYSQYRRPRGAVARTAVTTLSSPHVVVSLYLLSMGVLALTLALTRL